MGTFYVWMNHTSEYEKTGSHYNSNNDLVDDYETVHYYEPAFYYEGTETIKYITFYYDAYNRVNDLIASSVPTKMLTGPFEPHKLHSRPKLRDSDIPHNARLIQGTTLDRFELSHIEVTFMDGTTVSVAKADVLEMEPPQLAKKGGCLKYVGCYVATCVYGSYDCPQVWTLRRYRDDTLAATWYGRCFIRIYYAASPTLVKWFGKTKWFQRFWRKQLDKMVGRLQKKGVESTPYQDKIW